MSASLDRARFSRIAHGAMPFWNPLEPEVLEAWVEELALGAGARVLDVGCGRGELLLRVLARHGCAGVGVDPDADALALAGTAAQERGLEANVEWRAQQFTASRSDARAFDLGLCIGSTHAFGDLQATLDGLSACVRPGGLLLVGEGCWRQDPPAEYLAILGCAADAYRTHAGNRALALERGLDVLASHQTSIAAFQRYEEAYAANVRNHLATNPDEPQAQAFRDRIDGWSDAVARWGLQTLGFGLYLLRRP